MLDFFSEDFEHACMVWNSTSVDVLEVEEFQLIVVAWAFWVFAVGSAVLAKLPEHPQRRQLQNLLVYTCAKDDVCPVCCEVLGATGATLPCGHAFHVQCITDWLVTFEGKSCPVCRATVSLSVEERRSESLRSEVFMV